VAANIRKRLAGSNIATQKLYMRKVNLKKLTEGEGEKQYQVKISNSFAASDNYYSQGESWLL
jgi:hypothetical protein